MAPAYEEMVELELQDGTTPYRPYRADGRVTACVIQVFEGTRGISLQNTTYHHFWAIPWRCASPRSCWAVFSTAPAVPSTAWARSTCEKKRGHQRQTA